MKGPYLKDRRVISHDVPEGDRGKALRTNRRGK